MILRSKMAPLTISLASTGTGVIAHDRLLMALSQTSCIRSLRFKIGHTTPKLRTIFSLLSRPAPLLESIYLSSGSHTSDADGFSFPQDALPDAPRLRDVVFDPFNFSWGSAIFKHNNLINLRLKNTLQSSMSNSTIGQMMDALHQLPNLHILELSNSIPPCTTSCRSMKALEFRFLERLELSDRAAECIFLLRHTRYPACATVRLRSTSTEVEESSTIFSLLGQNSQIVEAGTPHSPVVIRSMRLISLKINGAIEISLFHQVGTTRCLCGQSDDLDPIIHISLIGGYTLGRASGCFLTSVSNNFDLSSLDSLCTRWSFDHSEIPAIRDSLGKLPKLETICVSRSLSEISLAINESPQGTPVERTEEVETFCPPPEKSQPSPSPVTVFRALRTFLIEDDFRRVYLQTAFIEMLMKRSDMKAPIDTLGFHMRPRLQSSQMRQVGKLVVNLEFEGKVVDVEDLESEGDFSDQDEYGGRDVFELFEDSGTDEDYFDNPYYSDSPDYSDEPYYHDD